MKFSPLIVLAVASTASAFAPPPSRSSIQTSKDSRLYAEASNLETTIRAVASFVGPALPFAVSALSNKAEAERQEKLIEESLELLRAKQKLKEEQFQGDIAKSIGAGTLGVIAFALINLGPIFGADDATSTQIASPTAMEVVVPPPKAAKKAAPAKSTVKSALKSDTKPKASAIDNTPSDASFKDLMAKLEVGQDESWTKQEAPETDKTEEKASEPANPEPKKDEKSDESLSLEDIKAAAAKTEKKAEEAAKEATAVLPELNVETKAASKEETKEVGRKEEPKPVPVQKTEEPKPLIIKTETLKPLIAKTPSAAPATFMDKLKASNQKAADEKKATAPTKAMEKTKESSSSLPKDVKPIVTGAAVLSVGVLGALVFVAQSDPSGEKSSGRDPPGPPRRALPQASSSGIPKSNKPKPGPGQSGTGKSYLENMVGDSRPVKQKPVTTTTQVDNGASAPSKPKPVDDIMPVEPPANGERPPSEPMQSSEPELQQQPPPLSTSLETPPAKKSYFPGKPASPPKKPPMGGGSYLDRLS